MPLNNFTVGSDCQVVILHPLAPQGRLDLQYVTGFKPDQKTKALMFTRLDGVTMNAEYPEGWTGSFDIERGNSALDDFISVLEQATLGGQNVQGGTIYQYVLEVDGSTSTYQYNSAVFKLTDAGTFKGAETVKQTLAFTATGRKRV